MKLTSGFQNHVQTGSAASQNLHTPKMNTRDPREEMERLARCFNTALISTRAESRSGFSEELHDLIQSPAFQQILQATRRLAQQQNIGEAEAASELVRAFRKADKIWSDYVYLEGLDRLRQNNPSDPNPSL